MSNTFRPMLAAEYDPDKFPLRFPVLASPKIDGIRCVIRHGQPLTRSLKPIPNRHIRAALSGLPDFDGELVVGDPRDPKAWNTTSSAVMSHDGEPDFTFFVFDYTHHELQTAPYRKRLEFVGNRAPMYGLKPLVHSVIDDLTELSRFEDYQVSLGYEGIMLRDPEGPYKWGRSTAKEGYLLKMKRFDDLEAVIIGAKERQHHIGEAKINDLGLIERDHKKKNFTGAGDLGAFVCDYNGIEFDVGSGFTSDQRIELWDRCRADSAELHGHYVRVKHQGFTPDGKPRFPIFQGFRDERDMG